MTAFLTILHIIFCFTLISVILLQAGKGQGLSGPAFGGGNVQSVFGTQAADFLTKATSVAAICFLLTSIGLDYLEVRKSRSLFQGAQSQESTLDVETVKKALEKIESEGEAGDVASAVSGTAETVANDAAETAEAVVTNVKEVVADSEKNS